MPLGFERLNVRKQSPNKLITFIEALDGPDKTIARDFLERVAAIVYPIMKDNGLAVMSLDEFPPNMEFWGRNFNAGECIQLVLKNPKTGEWLPFQFVQGVMIHELAHIKQMDHSRLFWAVNNKFSGELRVLRSKGYTGEGFWSAGRVLISAEYTQDRPLAESDMPHTLCGGTYRSRGRRRKNKSTDGQLTKKPKLTYAERQKRSKEKKFGPGEGSKVGADEATRVKLEKGTSKSKSTPKVAQSNRGRELRAAAALKRFETQQEETSLLKKEGEEAGDDTDFDQNTDEEEDEKIVDVGGGKFLVPVSGEEDGKAEKNEMKNELLELAGGCKTGGGGNDLSRNRKDGKQRIASNDRNKSNASEKARTVVRVRDEDDAKGEGPIDCDPRNRTRADKTTSQLREYTTSKRIGEATRTCTDPSNISNIQESVEVSDSDTEARKSPCSACSVINESDAVLCMICANVLEPSKMPNAWRCCNFVCGCSDYRNAGDVGICGVCGQRKGTCK